LEHPHGDQVKFAAEHFAFLKDCARIRARVDEDYAMPREAELRVMAARQAATGKTPAQLAMESLVNAWENAHERRKTP
jgi:hypothetical protein